METRIRVAALIVVEDRVLLVAAKSNPAYLVLPGGGVEPREELPAAVVRETAEEAGVAVAAGTLVAYRQVRREDRDELELYFTARPLQNPFFGDRVSEEDRLVRWVALQDLPRVAHFPSELAALCARAAASVVGALALPLTEL